MSARIKPHTDRNSSSNSISELKTCEVTMLPIASLKLVKQNKWCHNHGIILEGVCVKLFILFFGGREDVKP